MSSPPATRSNIVSDATLSGHAQCMSSAPATPIETEPTEVDELQTRTMRKIAARLIPVLLMLYVIAYLDRVNVTFAQDKLESDLGFSGAVYGFGAGIFFIGYFFLEVPSNLALHRFGARKWMARIMITWGGTSALPVFGNS